MSKVKDYFYDVATKVMQDHPGMSYEKAAKLVITVGDPYLNEKERKTWQK